MSAADAWQEWTETPRTETETTKRAAFMAGYRRALEDAADDGAKGWLLSVPNLRDRAAAIDDPKVCRCHPAEDDSGHCLRERAAAVAPRETKD